VGYEQFIQRDENLKEHIDTLLDALTHYRSKESDPTLSQANIVITTLIHALQPTAPRN
jgi:cell division septum initiation protein DivIVA